MTKLLGVIIANGLSSENRVFASLLASRGGHYDARVLMHQTAEDGTAHRFAELSGNKTVAYDTGWRPSPYIRRGNPLRAGVAIRYVRGIESLAADARQYDPDIVYSSQQHYDLRAASRITDQVDRAAQIVHLHYNIGPWLQRFVLNRLHTADHIVCVSDFIRQQAIAHGVHEERVTTVHNAVEPFPEPDPGESRARRAELGVPEGAFILGMVSRIDKGKGHLAGISAFERLESGRDDARLVIVGSGRIDREVRTRVANSPAADRIILTGFRTDVPELLPLFDALVHPALEDPCPLAVLEAMAAGLPVIGYDDGGMPELVQRDVTGILVERGDIDQLSQAMRSLQTEPHTARCLGAAGRDRLVSRFTPARAGKQFADIVTSVR